MHADADVHVEFCIYAVTTQYGIFRISIYQVVIASLIAIAVLPDTRSDDNHKIDTNSQKFYPENLVFSD